MTFAERRLKMIDKKIKLLALDLDGTTLRSNNTISEKVKEAIKKAVDSGIEVVAASGRPYHSMPEYILNFNGLNYFIASNGANVYKNRGEKIHSELLCESDVIKFLKITQKYDLILEAFIDGLTYTDSRFMNDPIKYGCSQAYVSYVKASHGCIDDMRQFIFDNRDRFDSIEIVCTDKLLRAQLRDIISKNIPDFYITSSSKNFIELMAKNATKAKGVEFLCNHLGINPEECCACGNADNDVDMIGFVGLGVAVKNASLNCIEKAKIIVADNNSDGVAQLVDILIEINSQEQC